MAHLVSITKVGKSFGLAPLFKDISFAVEERQRVAVIGRNGSGKSTLLRILAKLEDPDEGMVSWKKQLHLAYVAQEDAFDDGADAYDTLASALDEHDSERERKIGMLLGKIGLRNKNQAVTDMSGGEKKRLAIGRGLITEPEILLLDEPTNHLDIAGVLWLEELIREASFSTIFISHDRFFIQNVAERVIEVDRMYPGGYFAVQGAYSEFLDTRASYLDQLEQYRSSLANRVRREVEWLRQGAKARTTKQKARSDQANDLVAELQGITRIEQRADLKFSASNRKSKELIKLENISKSYDGRDLFRDVTFILSPGSRLGVVGLNGSGKTTFLKTILAEIPPDSGRVVHASKLRVALLDQMRSGINRDQTLQKVLCKEGDSVVFNGQSVHVAGWAKRFLFSQQQLSVPIKKLSGGEQARAILARIMVEPADVLVLDEPTNDLDIATLEVLEDALIEFPGAVVLVTHDRYLLDRVCQVVLGLSGGGVSNLFADHLQWERSLGSIPEKTEASPGRESKRDRGPIKKLGYTEQRELDGMEAKILSAERKIDSLELELASPELASNATKLQESCEKLATLQKEVETLYSRWAELEAKRKMLNGI